MIETDIDLIAGLRKQSPKAQQQMLDRYGRDVFAQVARLVPGIENAEEVYQDVFVKVFKNIDRYDEGKSALRTWILRIAYNEAISFLRHQRPTMVYIEDREGEADTVSETEVEETLGHANAETKQNQAFTEMFKVRGSLPPKTKKGTEIRQLADGEIYEGAVDVRVSAVLLWLDAVAALGIELLEVVPAIVGEKV